jgi:hypothetical protein
MHGGAATLARSSVEMMATVFMRCLLTKHLAQIVAGLAS